MTQTFRSSRAPTGRWSRDLEIADWFHGQDGLGDHGYCPAARSIETEHAVDAIIRVVKANPGIEIVTLGPLTNLALALSREPGLVRNVARCVVMGGAPCCEGNVTPAAEFNIWVDPEAARIVFQSGLPIELIGWQLSRGPAVLGEDDLGTLRSTGTRWPNLRCMPTAPLLRLIALKPERRACRFQIQLPWVSCASVAVCRGESTPY